MQLWSAKFRTGLRLSEEWEPHVNDRDREKIDNACFK